MPDDYYFESKARSARFDQGNTKDSVAKVDHRQENKVISVNVPKESKQQALPIEVSLQAQAHSLDVLDRAVASLRDTLGPLLGEAYADEGVGLVEKAVAPHSEITGFIETNTSRVDRLAYQIRELTTQLGG